MIAASSTPEPGAHGDGAAVERGPILRQFAAVLLGLVVGLVAVDVAVGRYDSAKDLSGEGMLAWDEALSWTNRPGFENERTTISSLGLRSPEIPADAPPDEVRILGVGASRTFGAGEGGPSMVETWSHYLEDACNRELEGSWRVQNGGVMGYSMRQSVRRALQLLDDVQPDLVLVFVSPGRQLLLDPSSARNITQLASGRLIPKDLERSVPAWLREPVAAAHGYLLSRSAIYSRYRSNFTDMGAVEDAQQKYVISAADPPPEIEGMLEESLRELELMARLCAQRGIEVRAVVLLEAYQDSQPEWESYLRRNGSKGAPPIGTPRTESTQVLVAEFAARGVKSWPLDDAITRIGTNRAMFTCDNAHWSAVGHRLVAQHLLRALRAEVLDQRLLQARRAAPR